MTSRSIPYPYVEGLRMDEAMNDLTLVTVGMYGDMLAPANGPPVRLVVPRGTRRRKRAASKIMVHPRTMISWRASFAKLRRMKPTRS